MDDIGGSVRLGQHSSFIMWSPPVTLQTVMPLLWLPTRETAGPDPKSVLMMESDKSLLLFYHRHMNKITKNQFMLVNLILLQEYSIDHTL